MDREVVKKIVGGWISSLVTTDPDFAWLKDVELTAEPAFLVDAKTKEGDDYKAGAVSIVVTPEAAPDAAAVERLYDALVDDRTLGHRAKRATFERPKNEREAGTIVVIPR